MFFSRANQGEMDHQVQKETMVMWELKEPLEIQDHRALKVPVEKQEYVGPQVIQV